MGLDIRLVIAAMFLVLGPILLVTGLVDGHRITQGTGGAMVFFGFFMLGSALIGRRRQSGPASQKE